MDDFNRSISQYIKTGKYYQDAHIWYANRFIFPVAERSYILLLLALFIISATSLVISLMVVDPAPAQVTYLSHTPDIAKSYAVILPAGDFAEEPQVNITKYMLATYILKRETYEFNHVKYQLDFVRNTTVADEYLKYQDYMSINNPLSPIMLYQDTNVREVKVNKIEFLQEVNNNQQAKIYFTATLRNLATNQRIDESLISIVQFQIDNVEHLLKAKAKTLNFLVLEYSVQNNNLK